MNVVTLLTKAVLSISLLACWPTLAMEETGTPHEGEQLVVVQFTNLTEAEKKELWEIARDYTCYSISESKEEHKYLLIFRGSDYEARAVGFSQDKRVLAMKQKIEERLQAEQGEHGNTAKATPLGTQTAGSLSEAAAAAAGAGGGGGEQEAFTTHTSGAAAAAGDTPDRPHYFSLSRMTDADIATFRDMDPAVEIIQTPAGFQIYTSSERLVNHIQLNATQIIKLPITETDD